MPITSDSEIEIRPSRKKSIFSLVGMIALAIPAGVIAYLSDGPQAMENRNKFLKFVLPALAIGVTFEGYRIFKSKPVVKINRQRIWWIDGRNGFPFDQTILWPDVHHFEINFSSTELNGIDIYVNDFEKHLSENKTFQGTQKKAITSNGTCFTIFVDKLDVDTDDLLSILKEWQKKADKNTSRNTTLQ